VLSPPPSYILYGCHCKIYLALVQPVKLDRIRSCPFFSFFDIQPIFIFFNNNSLLAPYFTPHSIHFPFDSNISFHISSLLDNPRGISAPLRRTFEPKSQAPHLVEIWYGVEELSCWTQLIAALIVVDFPVPNWSIHYLIGEEISQRSLDWTVTKHVITAEIDKTDSPRQPNFRVGYISWLLCLGTLLLEFNRLLVEFPPWFCPNWITRGHCLCQGPIRAFFLPFDLPSKTGKNGISLIWVELFG
jgi:hypothetical protein